MDDMVAAMHGITADLRALEAELRADSTTLDQLRLGQFIDWLERFPLVWSHIRVSAVAVRPIGSWIARHVRVVLQDTDTVEWPGVETAEIRVAQRAYPISELPELIRDLCRGEIAATRSPISETLLVRTPDSSPFKLSRGHEPGPSFFPETSAFSYDPIERYHRYELEWTAESTLVGYFPESLPAHTWFKRAEEKFEPLGYGTVTEAARRIGVIPERNQVDWSQQPSVTLIAPFPLAFINLQQTADRTRMVVEVVVGRLIPEEKAFLIRESTDHPVNVPQRIPLPPGEPSRLVEVPTPLTSLQQVKLQLIYDQQRIQRAEIKVLHPLKANVRFTALHLFEKGDGLLERGLKQTEKRAAHSFERSVYHFLTMLGFSVLWWGPNDKRMNDQLPMPPEQADLLAFSADDALVLMVECTVELSKSDKILKLAQRAKRLEGELKIKLGPTPPRVQPVFAIAIPNPEMPPALDRESKNNDVVLLTQDQIDSTLEKLKVGRPHSEVVNDLHEALRCGLQTL